MQQSSKDVKDVNVIVCHLGNGASLSAVSNGKCIVNQKYNASHNLQKPLESTSDEKTSKKRFAQLCLWAEDCEEMKKHFEKANPGYELVECIKEYNDETKTFAIRVKMRLIETTRMRR